MSMNDYDREFRRSSNMEEIKPCPFCGGEAVVCEWEDRKPKLSIECDDEENCGAVLAIDYNSTKEAISAWNTRAVDKENQRLLTTIKRAIEVFDFTAPEGVLWVLKAALEEE